MIDALMRRKAAGVEVVNDPDYNHLLAITGVETYNSDGEDLVVLFPPWHGGKKSLGLLAGRLARKGAAVRRYVFNDNILHDDPEVVARSFQTIKSEVADELHQIADDDRYRSVGLVGVSLGTPALTMVASEFSRFDYAHLVAPGSRLGPCMYEGDMTQNFRASYERQGIASADDLDEILHEIAPVRHLDAFAGKRVNVTVSNNDRAIPTEYQHEFAMALHASAAAEATVSYTNLGHYMTVANFCIRGSVLPAQT